MKKPLFILVLILVLSILVGCGNEQIKEKQNEEHVHQFVFVAGKKSTCTEYGYSDYSICLECGEIKDKVELNEYAAHDYDFVQKVQATKEDPGYTEYECKECHEIMKEYGNALNREDEQMKGIKVLLIGNSLTNYNTLMNCLKGVANGEGYNIRVDKCAYGNQYLYDFVEGPDGDYYTSLLNKVFSARYDLAILQDGENNVLLGEGNCYDTFRKMKTFLDRYKIKPMIYETYQYSRGTREIGLNYQESSYIADGRYCALASELGCSVSRVAIAFNKVVSDKKDSVIPLYNEDGVHPSSYGTYLTALVHTATLFGKRLDGVSYTYNEYIKDKTITWHCENELIEIDDKTQKYLEYVANFATFDFQLAKKYQCQSEGISEEAGTYNGFKKQIEVDIETSGEIQLDYKLTSGTWNVNNKNSFMNTSEKAVLMFQKDLIENKDEECVLSFDICVKKELEDCTYARGIVLACENKDMKYFDGTDALVIGRYCWNGKPHMESMRVWDPTKFPSYNYKSGYTFNCGFNFKDIDKPVMEVGKTYHVQITINANAQRYGYYVDGVLYGYVVGYDLPKGGYFGILSYDSNRIEYSNFKFNGKKLVWNENK